MLNVYIFIVEYIILKRSYMPNTILGVMSTMIEDLFQVSLEFLQVHFPKAILIKVYSNV